MQKRRLFRILLYITILTGLIIYGKRNFPETTLHMCLKEPQRYDGVTLTIGNEAIVHQLTADGFIIKQMGELIPVKSSKTASLEPGVFVNSIAVFHKEGWLEAKQVRVMKYRRIKIGVSILPVIIITVLFFRHFYFQHWQFGKR